MTGARLSFILVLGGFSLVWAAIAFTGYDTRFDHRGIERNIRSGENLPAPRELSAAIADYERTLAMVPCNKSLDEDYALLLAQAADNAVLDGDDDASLERMQNGLSAHLACSPTDGKAWLDYAMISAYREGFTKRSLEAYAMSAKVAPGESWLAEKRLLFALQFRPLLNAQAHEIVARDLEVLERAHPNRMSRVMKEAQVESASNVAALFKLER